MTIRIIQFLWFVYFCSTVMVLFSVVVSLWVVSTLFYSPGHFRGFFDFFILRGIPYNVVHLLTIFLILSGKYYRKIEMYLVSLLINLLLVGRSIASVDIIYSSYVQSSNFSLGAIETWGLVVSWSQLISFVVGVILLIIYWKDYYLWGRQYLKRFNKK